MYKGLSFPSNSFFLAIVEYLSTTTFFNTAPSATLTPGNNTQFSITAFLPILQERPMIEFLTVPLICAPFETNDLQALPPFK